MFKNIDVLFVVVVLAGNCFGKPAITEITVEEIENSTGSEIIEEIKEENGNRIVGWVKIFQHYSNHSSHCHFRNRPEVHLAPGKSTTVLGQCMQITCIDPSMNSLSASWCPSIFPPKDCKVKKGDKSKPYPDCCPKLDC